MAVAGPSTEQLVGHAGGTRRPDDLRALALHPSPKIRRIVAANPATPADVIITLLDDPAESVRRRAAAHRSMPIAHLIERGALLDRPDELARVLDGRELTPEDLHLLAHATPPPFRWYAARSAQLSRQDIRHLATFDNLVGVLAVAHPLPMRVFARATRRSDLETLEAIASSPHLGAVRRWWLTDGPIGERRHVARRIIVDNERTSRLHLHRLRWWTMWPVKAALVRRGAVSRMTLRWWTRSGPDGLLAAVAEHPRTPTSSLRVLSTMSAKCRIATARNPALPTELARRLAQSSDPWIAGTAMGNPNLPVDEIERLSRDTSLRPWQLRQLALNPSCPIDTREQLLTWLSLGGAGAGDPLFTPDDRGASRLPFASWDELTPHLHVRSAVGMFRARAVSGAGQLPEDILRQLVDDPSPAVRYAAAGYMNATSLKLLARDEDPQVRGRAAVTHQEAQRRGVNLRARGVDEREVRRRRQTTAVVSVGVILLVGGMGALSSRAGDRAPIRPLPSTATIVKDPSHLNGALIDLTTHARSSVFIITGPSLCEELGGDTGAGVETIAISYCGTPGPVTINVRSTETRDIIELDPPPGVWAAVPRQGLP